MADRKAAAGRAAAIADQMAALRAVPAPAPEPAEAKAREPKRAARAPKAQQMPAQQKPEWVRIPFMTDEEQRKALAAARLEDGIEATARLRAMVKLWMESPQFRRNVDKLAAADRSRDRRAKGYSR